MCAHATKPRGGIVLFCLLRLGVLNYSIKLLNFVFVTTQVYSEFVWPLLKFTLSSTGPLLRPTLSSAWRG